MSRYSSISLVINITILYRPSFCARSWCFICILWWKKRPRRIDPKVPPPRGGDWEAGGRHHIYTPYIYQKSKNQPHVGIPSMDGTGIISSMYQLASLRLAYQSTRPRVENFKLSWWTTEAWFQKNISIFFGKRYRQHKYMFKIWTWFSGFRVNYVSWQSFSHLFCVGDGFLTSSHCDFLTLDCTLGCVGSEVLQIFRNIWPDLILASFSPTFETFWEYIHIYIIYIRSTPHPLTVDKWFLMWDPY